MGIIAFIILGVIVGAIAKAIWKGDEPGGFLGTVLVGVVGALAGGLIASAVGLGGLGSFFSIGTWLIALAGAFLFLFAFSLLSGDRSGRRADAH
ncbi:MAG TPA: GlsB/YeaQ/YmgE family stress response membrane protein [Solirubrobacteraceae bacterium]|nr:GlsB/YeaQ/YmgE family stress response membrane protein [Solirubrobacteraceae bacterium]